MAYRVEENKTPREMLENVRSFLVERIQVYEMKYDSAVGNGSIENIRLSDPNSPAPSETWTIKCVDENSPATFDVTGNVSGTQGQAKVGEEYDNGIIKFTVRDGGTSWRLNDIVTFKVQVGSFPPFQRRHPDEWWDRYIFNGNKLQRLDLISPPTLECNACTVTAGYKTGPQGQDVYCIMGTGDAANRNSDFSWYYDHISTDTLKISPRVTFFDRVTSEESVWKSAPSDFSINIWVRSIFTAGIAAHASDGGYYIASSGIFVGSANESYNGGPDNITGIQIGISPNGSMSIGWSKSYVVRGRTGVTANYFYTTPMYVIHDAIASTVGDEQLDLTEDWIMFTVTVDKSNEVISCYCNGVLIGQYGDDSSLIKRLFPVLSYHAVGGEYETVVFNRVLSTTEISALYTSDEPINKNSIDVYTAVGWGDTTMLPSVRLDSTSSNWVGGIGIFTNPSLSTTPANYVSHHQYGRYFGGFDMVTGKHNLFGYNWFYRTINPSATGDFLTRSNYYFNSYAKTFTVNDKPYITLPKVKAHNISKYWAVTDGEALALGYKIYEPQSSTVNDPVYQIAYIGNTEFNMDKFSCIHLGTNDEPDREWTDTANLYLGLSDRKNWYAYPDLSGNYWNSGPHTAFRGPEKGVIGNSEFSTLAPISNNYYIFPIQVIINKGTKILDSWNGSSWQYTQSNTSYGQLKFVHQVLNKNINLEDEVIIGGERYVILRDITRNNVDSIYALQLKKDY